MARRLDKHARRTGLAAVVATAVFAASAWAAPTGPSPFRHDLRRVDYRFRVAIEDAPIELGEGLGTSEAICRLATKAEERGDAGGASADWSTLSHLVDELDKPAAARAEGALLRADAGLLELRERYSDRWPDREKVAKLGRGVARAREGARMLAAAMEKVTDSFEAWSAHRCQDATDSIEAGIARIPAAVTRINAGMRLLWKLAYPKA